MSLSKKNSEGYLDLTAYEAISAADREIAMMRYKASRRTSEPEPPKVYICSPFRGDAERNVANALRYCRFAVEHGKFPIAPHCYLPRFMDDANPAERELAIAFGLRLLRDCREIWVFGSTISDGMSAELAEAKRIKIKMKHFIDKTEDIHR